MRTFFSLLKTELKLNIRNMNMVIFAVIMPVVVLVILGFIYQTKPAFSRGGVHVPGAVHERGLYHLHLRRGLMGLPLWW